jgi:hypothetical protein
VLQFAQDLGFEVYQRRVFGCQQASVQNMHPKVLLQSALPLLMAFIPAALFISYVLANGLCFAIKAYNYSKKRKQKRQWLKKQGIFTAD